MIRPGSRRGLSALNGVSGALVGVPDSQGMFRSRSRGKALARVVYPSSLRRQANAAMTVAADATFAQTSDPTPVLNGT